MGFMTGVIKGQFRIATLMSRGNCIIPKTLIARQTKSSSFAGIANYQMDRLE